ncbi:hypothetical protein K504DRAFT_480086 [Pleomassaria siparia CBS 279.74]|uniref:Uncharacterized protein n=1 Tax=Pleomassaria siparia CBS 279.74 TaxID=1314801 RepID=A0A6G1KHV8_9PLEO|nr:hypothetical protein K504DRAFT_480086 [Pleomassaria siparia CBS 279.74]
MSRFLFPSPLFPGPTSNLDVNSDSDSDHDVFFSPLIEEREPLLSRDTRTSSIGSTRQISHQAANVIPRPKLLNVAEWPLRHSASDQRLRAPSHHHRVVFSDDSRSIDSGTHAPVNTPLNGPTFVFPTTERVRRSLVQRSASNPGPQTTEIDHHGPTIDAATLQEQLVTQTKHVGKLPVRPWRVRRVRTASGPFQWTNPQAPGRPGFRWFPRSNSDPYPTPVDKQKRAAGKNISLKPCIKQKSKSAATTPPNAQGQSPDGLGTTQKLRRVKTVDFEEGLSKKLLSLPPLEPTKNISRVTLCPGLTMNKSLPADAAVTRTDVHVVAIAPSWNADDIPDEGGIDPATPTMQIVESKSGCYEIVWDDVPLKQDVRTNRRGSSASQALAAASPETSHGLHRVNTKLSEWSFGNGSPSELFKPQIVVFPDEDGRTPRFDCAIEDDDDTYIIIAPPNSERPSATPSRHQSRPGSIERAESDSLADDEATPTSSRFFFEKDNTTLNSLLIPDPDTPKNKKPGHPIGTHRRVRKSPALRRFSNVEESDLKFRGHRDSVTLARSRIFNAGGVSPELFMHRDSVSIAKKRMHTRNHAISSAREIPKPRSSRGTASEPSFEADDLGEALPVIPAKAVAKKALKSSSSASMLIPQQTSMNRHIRIVE